MKPTLPLFISLLFALIRADCSSGSSSSNATIRSELADYMSTYGFVRPTRSKVDKSRPWRCGAPNYDSADLLFFKGRTKNHTSGGLESLVENLVKEWEMEASHLEFADWSTVSHNLYSVASNGNPPLVGEKAATEGNYNALLKGVDESLWSGETFESSHAAFRGAFPTGFAWELIEVLAGPPRVVFSWRHWATFDGEYRGRSGDNKLYEMYGLGAVTVNNELKVGSIEVYYKPEQFLRALQGELDLVTLSRGATIFGSGMPIAEGGTKSDVSHSCSAGSGP